MAQSTIKQGINLKTLLRILRQFFSTIISSVWLKPFRSRLTKCTQLLNDSGSNMAFRLNETVIGQHLGQLLVVNFTTHILSFYELETLCSWQKFVIFKLS